MLINHGPARADQGRRWLLFALLAIVCPMLSGCTVKWITESGYHDFYINSVEEIRRTYDDHIIYRGYLSYGRSSEVERRTQLGVRYLSGPLGTGRRHPSRNLELLGEKSLEKLGRGDVYFFPTINWVPRDSKKWHLYPDNVRDVVLDSMPPPQWENAQVIFRNYTDDWTQSERPIFKIGGKYFQVGQLGKYFHVGQLGKAREGYYDNAEIELPGLRSRSFASSIGTYAFLPVVVAADVLFLPVYIVGGVLTIIGWRWIEAT